MKKIGIVGGGILGLTLAYRLAKNGLNVTILEKSKDLGGLASPFPIGKSHIEKYYHHFFKSDIDLQSLLTELNLGNNIAWNSSRMGLFDGEKLYSFSSAIDILKFNKLNIFERIRLGLVSFYLQKERNVNKFKNITAYNWCNKYFGKRITEVLWKPLLESKFEDKYDSIAMSWFWTRIHDRSSSRETPLKDEKLGYINGSFKVLIDKLESEIIKYKGVIIKNANINKYYRNGDKHIIEYGVMDNSNNERLEFDVIVSTISPKAFVSIFNYNNIINKQYLNNLNNISFIGAYCFIIELKKSFSKYYWTSINDIKSPFVALVEHTNFVNKKEFDNKNIIYLGKYTNTNSKLFRMDKEKLFSLCINYLKKINPSFNKNQIIKYHFFKANEAQHIVNNNYNVLTYNSGIKNLYFAHFSQIFPHDRGTNYAIAQANELFKIIDSK